jgi:membrane fusion protein (multidrug efflux system)
MLTLAAAPFLLLVVVGCSSAEGQNGQDDDEAANDEAAAAPSTASRVEVAAIRESEAGFELNLPGEIRGAHDATLGSAMGGFIERVLVENGDEVRRGQTLIRVDSQSASVRVAQAEVELRSAEREVQRGARLGDALAQAQRDNYQTRYDAAAAAHRAAQLTLSRSIIKAPFDGVIANLEADVGEIAPPGAPLVRLVELDHVKVTISVSDRDVVALSAGMPARVTTDAASGTFEGRVSHINPAADLQTRSFLVDIELDNPDRTLLPGMIAQVRIAAALAEAALVVPQDWVVTKMDGLGVFVEDAGVARWRPIVLGSVVRQQVVVTEGLSLGDRVIVTGQRELEEGDEVLVVREGECCTAGRVRY